MNREEAKNILLLYRHGTEDADDTQIAEALALAERDPELKDWLVKQCARQFVLREKFRLIAAPAGFKEQIISEQAVHERMVSRRRNFALATVAALVFLAALIPFWLSYRGHDDTLAVYQNRMAGVALRGYGMDLTTNDPVQIRDYLAQNHAPSNFVLPEKLKQASLAGCAIEGWQGVKVSMICFRSSRATPNVSSDIWLFVVDRTAVKKLATGMVPQFSEVNRLMTTTWIQGDKLYFLGTTGDARTIQQYL